MMDDAQAALAEALKPLFPPYLNSLGLTDENGAPLTLDADGTGSFADRVRGYVIQSAQRALDDAADRMYRN